MAAADPEREDQGGQGSKQYRRLTKVVYDMVYERL
jgi:hypothetical protein